MTCSIILQNIRCELVASSTLSQNASKQFFKTSPGGYAESEQFLGVTVPNIRKIAARFKELDLQNIATLLASPFNEERLLALIILTLQYANGDTESQNRIYDFYLANLRYVNNWNLVDSSAHLILGEHLLQKDCSILYKLAASEEVWMRRVSIVATWCFIKNQYLDPTFKIALMLKSDKHDLIHKAVGWMLREAGKKDVSRLCSFLEQNAATMPRTMLRYAIERLSEDARALYLQRKKV